MNYASFIQSNNQRDEGMDQVLESGALAKCIAYIKCNDPKKVEKWFRILAGLLGFSHLIKP